MCLVWFLLCALEPLGAAQAQQGAASTVRAAAPEELRTLTLQLRWDHRFQFAGYYVAEWQGYYAEEGLTVTFRNAITPDGAILDPIAEVSAGRADFGIGGADVLVARGKGEPVKLLAALYQRSPIAVIARRDKGIDSPADLLTRRVRRIAGDLSAVELDAMMRAQGLDPDDLSPPYDRAAQSKQDAFEALRQDRIDAYTGYAVTGSWRAQRVGLPVTLLRPSAFGIDFYGDGLFTTIDRIDAEPELIERFLRASLKGWAYALEHRREIADRISREFTPRLEVPDLAAFNRFLAEEVSDLTLYPFVRLGHLDQDRLVRMYDALRQAGLVPDAAKEATDLAYVSTWYRHEPHVLMLGLAGALVLMAISAALIVLRLWQRNRRDQAMLLQLQEEREQLATLLEEAPIALCTAIPDSAVITWANREARRLLCGNGGGNGGGNGESQTGLEQRSLTTFVATDPQNPHDALPALLHGQGERLSRWIRDVRLTRSNGTAAPLPASLLPNAEMRRLDLRLAYGHRPSQPPAAVTVALVDVTERQLGMEMLDRVREDLERQMRSRNSELEDTNNRLKFEIIERERIDQALREREALYRGIFDMAGIAIAIVSPDGRFKQVNDAFVQFLGYSHEELAGMGPADVSYPDDRESSMAQRRLVAEGLKDSARLEKRYLHKDGSLRWGDITVTAVRDLKGNIFTTVAAISDITERKWAEARLEQAHGLLRAVLDSSPDPVAAIDADFRFQAVNPAYDYVAAAFFGLEIHEGMHFETLAAQNPLWRTAFETVWQRALDGETFTLSLELPPKGSEDGEGEGEGEGDAQGTPPRTRFEITSGPVRDSQGHRIGAVHLMRDTTERDAIGTALRESEARFRAMFETAPNGMALTDLEGRFLMVNEGLCRMLGYSHEEMLPMRIQQLSEDRDVERNLTLRARLLAGEIDHFQMEKSYRHKQGHLVPTLLSVALIRDDRQAPLYFIGIVQDNTERKRYEEELSRHIQAMERAKEELEQFNYIASHDLQEPLRTLISYTQLLQEDLSGPLPSDAQEDLTFITQAAQRMRRLVQDLLALSRSSRTHLQQRRVDLNALLDLVISDMRTIIDETGTTIERGPLSSVKADQGQIGQVLQNLISNAIKFRRAAPPRLRIESEILGEMVAITVEDNGIGIEDAYIDTIFVAFKRLHGMDAYPGSGIGLAIVRKIVERHGGTITVTSIPGQGSTFRFTLPLWQEGRDD